MLARTRRARFIEADLDNTKLDGAKLEGAEMVAA